MSINLKKLSLPRKILRFPKVTISILFWWFAFLYFSPVLFGTVIARSLLQIEFAWTFWGWTLLISTLCFALGYLLLHKFIDDSLLSDKLKVQKIAEPDQKAQERLLELTEKLSQAEEKGVEYADEIAFRNEQLQLLTQERDLEKNEKEHLQEALEQLRFEKEEEADELKASEIALNNILDELRSTVEQKEEEIEKLRQKVQDLSYEIKTLLQVSDTSSASLKSAENTFSQGESVQLEFPDLIERPAQIEAPKQIHTERDAHKQLRRCIDIAQKMTGSQYLGNYHARFRDFSPDAYALDLRRLCESLRSEKNTTVFVYSLKEKRLLFINNQIKNLLGWTADQFMQDFSKIRQTSLQEWNTAMQQLGSLNELQTHLCFRNKRGEEVVAHCRLGLIPTGIFRANVIGVLYPA